MTNEQVGRHLGRPRRAAIDEAIVRAAVDLMTETGVEGTTLSAVARRAGVARATVYLRWPNRAALIGGAARVAVGGQPITLTGDLTGDIRFAARYIEQIFAVPALSVMLPEIIRGVLARPAELAFESVVPRRREFGRLYRLHAAAQGFDPTVDPFLAFDVLLGTAISSLLANGRPMSAGDAATLAEVLIRGLRVQARAGNDEAAG